MKSVYHFIVRDLGEEDFLYDWPWLVQLDWLLDLVIQSCCSERL